MKKKNIIISIAAVFLIILITFLLFFQEKKLDPTSDEITKLYSSLGKVDTNICGGLITYSDKEITKDKLDEKYLLCRAYYNIEDSKKISETAKSNTKSDKKINICKVGENTTLATSDESETECAYQIITKKDLEESYNDLYASKLDDIDTFYITDKEACFKEGEKYYCGNAEAYNISLAPEATIYRVLDKAIENLKGDIVIYDYFLKISNDACYTKNNNEKSDECSNALKSKDLSNDDEIISLVKEYGSIYKHTFKKGKNKNHYWVKTELK